jgi:curved DNA-binding protein CbpA
MTFGGHLVWYGPTIPTRLPSLDHARAGGASVVVFFKDRDPYAILGVPASAELGEIKSAYRALARRYHPDMSTSELARRRMIEINRAWELLSDPTRRADLDRRRGGRTPGASSAAPRPSPAPPGASPTPPPAGPVWMARHAPDRRSSGWAAGAKGRPPGNPSGSVLDFGIYLGWSVGEIARVDPLYLDWLADRPEGRRYADEIAMLRGRGAAPASPLRSRRWSFG